MHSDPFGYGGDWNAIKTSK